MLRIDYATECERAAASLVLTGYVRGLLCDNSIPLRHRSELRRLADDVSRAHGTLDVVKQREVA